eukprot:TRINITY_DN3488_c0_g2_i1.p1 TRINITY_DN3488_c0_g2~~TRINITY_DN3488_c0_g2_i1.p1  ORF type:complete len:350 (+),score=65.56 TRINITY_DN3488_c0_g2_i1:44-1051(+)
MAISDRIAFTMLMVRKAIRMVGQCGAVLWVSYGAMLLLMTWMLLWCYGVSGVVAFKEKQPSQWWLLLLFSISLFWTSAVVGNTVHVTVAGRVTAWLTTGREGAPLLPRNATLQALKHAAFFSLGSVCYGSLFTAGIRTIRWAVRSLRARIERNECLDCCVIALFRLVEMLVRLFNKYGFVVVAMSGKGFNSASLDAWELLQSSGVEALIAYDLTGAVLVMTIVLGGLLNGTAVGSWCWLVKSQDVLMVGATSMLMGAMLVGMTMVVVSATVTAIYVIYAEDPRLIGRVDAEFAAQLAEALHNRLQHRSKKQQASRAGGLREPGRPSPGLPLPSRL